MQFLIVLLLLTAIVLFITMPLRRQRTASRAQAEQAAEAERQLGDLEAAREAKYREIRDAELDHSTGKLSDADYQALDGVLRAEAIEILRALDGAREQLAAEAEDE
jgi:flagellar biosynthesis/type III secretory pathway M-ring protein FliF/YscJ